MKYGSSEATTANNVTIQNIAAGPMASVKRWNPVFE